MVDLLPIEIIAALIALIPGLGTVYLAWRLNQLQDSQNRHDRAVAAASYKLSLFHLRAEVFEGVQAYVAEFVTSGRPSVEAAVELRRHARNARFLFPAEVQAFVADLAKKGFDYQRAYLLREAFRERARHGEALTEAEARTRDACRAEMQAIDDWLTEVWESGRYLSVFEPFLTLPETLS